MIRPILFLAILSLFSCSDNEPLPTPQGGSSSQNWLVPEAELEFGANRDAIRAVDAPVFTSVDEISYLDDEDLLLVMKQEGEVRAYSLNILNWHEIVNDVFGAKNLAVTYCPLTGTGICWNREIDGEVTTFGVSGWLYNSNLIAFDRATESYWSQMRVDCINGAYVGRSLGTYQMMEMSWKALKERLPEAKVLSADTGFDLPYLSYPYYDYRTNDDFFFVPLEFTDDRLPAKEKVLTIIEQGDAKVYPLSHFPTDEISVINDVFNGQPVVVICQPDQGLITAYKSNLEGAIYEFTAIQGERELVMRDAEGTTWNLFGEGVEGPGTGKQLRALEAINGYWFAWTLFFPRAEIYE